MSNESELLRPHVRPRVPLGALADACQLRLVSSLSSDFSPDLASAEIEIQGIAIGSNEVLPGDLFVAVAGLKTHGARFTADALARGAVAILTDNAGLAEIAALDVRSAPVLVSSTPDLRAVAARCAAYLYSAPSHDVQIAGVTGTNGKTTTSFFLDAIARATGGVTGLLGTVEIRLGEQSEPSVRTTVEAPVLQGFLARCRDAGARLVTMEVSSHAIALSRIAATQFQVVGFTNLQHDHLDFHHTMEEYFATKSRLFTAEFAQRGVIIADDHWTRRLAENCDIPVSTISTPLTDDNQWVADWVVKEVRLARNSSGLDFVLENRDGTRVDSYSPLLGDVNVSNAALATVMALTLGFTQAQIRTGLMRLAVVPGRMEVVSKPGQPLVIVDYAHTTEALELALDSLRTSHHANGSGRLIVVTGSAGERDTTKRPLMGQAVFERADVCVITDDDPYSEDMASIRAEILVGITSLDSYQSLSESERERRVIEVSPREGAISYALRIAQPNDTVLLAGRGHESIQEINGVHHVLDDRVFARQLLKQLYPDQP